MAFGGYHRSMEKEKKPGNVFDDDDLDEAITNSDDTGMVENEREITQEEMLRNLEEPD